MPSYLGSSVLYIFGPKWLHQDLEAVLARAMLPPVFPVTLDELRSLRVIRNISESEMIVFSEPDAPPQVCNVYREYEACSPWEVRDVEGYAGGDRQLIQFAHGADLLIHDAEFTSEEYLDGNPPKQGWGHSTWEMAVEVAQAAGVKKLALTHHNAHHDDTFLEDVEQQAQTLFSAAIVACEGLTLKI